tara:strand:+ start:302 stop:754 length:453 start_codon:yes stop_codon:yes gene_type:complete
MLPILPENECSHCEETHMKLNQVTVGCLDYDRSLAFYQRLGLTQIVHSPPRYARFETPTGETFSIHAVEKIGTPSTLIYFECDELDAKVADLQSAGIAFATRPTDQSWGWREARLRDPAGNSICLFHGGDNRRFPPWRINHQPKEKGNEP